jgi:aldose 1-epimerase
LWANGGGAAYVAIMGEVRPASGDQWTIESGYHRAVVVQIGGGLRSYSFGDWPVLDGYAEDEVAPGAAGQILAPWPNRIRDGQYAFAGQAYALALSEPERYNAAHGLVRWQPWQADAIAPDQVELSCLIAAQAGYPWNVRLTTTWSVGGDGLRCAFTATNLSTEACPFGLGFHPYVRFPSTTVDETMITLSALTRIVTDDRLIPTERTSVVGSAYDFSGGRPVGEAKLDNAFTDLDPDDNAVILSSPMDGHAIRVWGDDAFRWWQLFTGDTLPGDRFRRSIAVEPMTCPANAFASGTDLVVLEPGETWRAGWGITPARP